MSRNCLSLMDFTAAELLEMIDFAQLVKFKMKNDSNYKPLKDKILGMIFEKSSTRTRLSFETGIKRLGGDAVFLSSKDIQLGRGESISDTAKIISRYVDAIMIRTFEHARIEEFANAAAVPVINGLTNLLHPCQILSDLLTIKEHFGRIDGLKIAYVGDGNNIANSWLIAAGILGLNLTIGCPDDLSVSGSVLQRALYFAHQSNAQLNITNNAYSAVKDADVIYTDVWMSMGDDENVRESKFKMLNPFQVNKELVKYANKDYIFMHCLPAHRSEEVTADIIDGEHSVVVDEAENRTYAQMAVLIKLLQEVK